MPTSFSGPNSANKMRGNDTKTRNTNSVQAAGQSSQSLIEQQLKKIEGILSQSVSSPKHAQIGSNEPVLGQMEANEGRRLDEMAGSVLFNRAEQFKSKLESVLSKSKTRSLA